MVPLHFQIRALPFGNYTFTITNLQNSITTCETTVFTNPNTDFIIHEIPNSGEALLSIPDICLGEDAQVTISDINPGSSPDLPDGNYSIIYDLSGANISVANTDMVTIVGGSGIFSIPAVLLTNTGITTIDIVIITNLTTGCNAEGLPVTSQFFGK